MVASIRRVLQKDTTETINSRFRDLFNGRPYLSLWRSLEAISIISALESLGIEPGLKGGNTVDIGCGDGLTTRGIGWRFSAGIEPDTFSATQALNSGQYEMVVVGDATELPLKDGIIDTALSNCVFEHIFKIEEAFSEVRRILAGGGSLILTMPVRGLVSDIVFFLPLSLIGLYGYIERFIDKGLRHFHYFDGKILAMIEDSGLRVIYRSYYMPDFLVSWWLFLRYAERVFRRLHLAWFWRCMAKVIEKLNCCLVRSSHRYMSRGGGGVVMILTKEGE